MSLAYILSPFFPLTAVLILQSCLQELLIVLLTGTSFLAFSLPIPHNFTFSFFCRMYATSLCYVSIVWLSCSTFSIDPFLLPTTQLHSAPKTFHLKVFKAICFISLPEVSFLPTYSVIHPLPGLQNSSQLAFPLKTTDSSARFIPNFTGFIVTNCTISSGCCFLDMIPEVKQPELQCYEECFLEPPVLMDVVLQLLPLPMVSV